MVALKLTSTYGFNSNLQFIISALVASLTVSGKAIGKNIAQNHTNSIVYFVSKIVSFFDMKKK